MGKLSREVAELEEALAAERRAHAYTEKDRLRISGQLDGRCEELLEFCKMQYPHQDWEGVEDVFLRVYAERIKCMTDEEMDVEASAMAATRFKRRHGS